MAAADRREVTLPLQLMVHLRQGDVLHFAAEPDVAHRVVELHLESGVVIVQRDWGGPTFSQWLHERAGVIRGG